MYKIRENDISLSHRIHSVTWHPFIFASISGRLIADVDTSRPNYTCMHTHIFTVWQISLFRSCDNTPRHATPRHATQKYHFRSISPTFTGSRNLQEVHKGVLLSRTITMRQMMPDGSAAENTRKRGYRFFRKMSLRQNKTGQQFQKRPVALCNTCTPIVLLSSWSISTLPPPIRRLSWPLFIFPH